MRALLVEPQRIFVPALWSMLERVGLDVRGAMPEPDFKTLAELQPEFVLFDIDFVSGNPVNVIRIMRMLLPVAIICLYGSTDAAMRWLKPWNAVNGTSSSANGVISKSATEEEFLEGLTDLLHTGSYTDWRAIPWTGVNRPTGGAGI